MSIVQSPSVIETSDLQNELERTKERFENCIIKKENEHAKLWNDWYKKCEECKYDNISYDEAYNNMQHQIERLQAHLGDLKGQSMNTQCASDTLYPLSYKLDDENVSLESQNSREYNFVPNKTVKASVRTKPITISQPHVITKQDVNANSDGLSSTGVDNSAKTRRPQSRSNTKNDRVSSASKSSCIKNKEVEVEEHHRNLLLSNNKKHMSYECNNVKLAIRNDKSKVVCAMCKQCLITANHDVCMLNYVNDMNSHTDNQNANVSNTTNQKKHIAKVKKSKKLGSKERLASPKPMKPITCLRRSPTERIFDLRGKLIDSSESEYQSDSSEDDTSLINFVWKFMGTVRFEVDHIAAILGYSDLQWGNILITRVYFVEVLGHSLFSVGQLCDLDLEVAFRRNSCFVRNLKGVDLLKGNRITNLYTINPHEMVFASPICLMARATSTKSWLWHQRLSHLNFDTINELAKNDLVTGLSKFKYHKEHLCPSCEQGKSKKAPHKPKPVPNSKQRLHLLHMDLCGPMKVGSINRKRYVMVIVDDYSCYTWVHFLGSKDEAPEEIKTFLKKIQVLLQASVIDQNRVVERRNRTLVDVARTMLIFSCASLFLWAEAIAIACYTQTSSGKLFWMPSTTPSYFPGPSTPPSYSPGHSRNAECTNCKLLIEKLHVLETTLEMYIHPEKHTIDSTALLHEFYNDTGKFSLK
ncbi:retrovirus-related pol polyprotein from transposon TNT 1-94 [Tanacetum coccineum]